MRPIQQAILDTVKQLTPPPAALLDIGSGDGVFIRELARSLPYAKVTGVDPIASMHKPGRNAPPGAVRIIQAGAEKLPFTSNTFDVIIASLSFHHWADKLAGLCEAFRVLKPGGRLIIGDPLLIGWLGNRFWGWLAQKTDGGVFSIGEEISGFLEQAGFGAIQISLVPKTMKSLYLVIAAKLR